jgi:hypothetical protein
MWKIYGRHTRNDGNDIHWPLDLTELISEDSGAEI